VQRCVVSLVDAVPEEVLSVTGDEGFHGFGIVVRVTVEVYPLEVNPFV